MAPRSTERFLTTHTGSLPRPDDLIRMMYAKEEGVPVDPEALAMRVRRAVADVVQKQAEAGIDVVVLLEQSRSDLLNGRDRAWKGGHVGRTTAGWMSANEARSNSIVRLRA